MMTPKRIQRKATKGWRLPENTISVTRPGKWGNPLKIVGDQILIDAGYRRKILDPWVLLCFGDLEEMLRIYESILIGVLNIGEYGLSSSPDLTYWHNRIKKQDLNELRDYNLACWCNLQCKCHIDVIFKTLYTKKI